MSIKRKFKKLKNNPEQFVTDYLKKRPLLQTKVEKLSVSIPSSDLHYKLYQSYKKQSFNAKAEESLRIAIALKKNPIYLYELGLRLKQKKQWWQAVESFDEAIKLSKEVSPDWYKEYALSLMQMNRHEEASKAWEEALISSKDANGWFMYSDALSLSKQKDKYEEAVAKTIALDNKFNAKKYGIGIFYEKKGKWQEASKAYANQVLKEPLDAELRYRYGLSLDRCYAWAEAEKEYARAIAIKPENIDWYYRLGFVRERQEKYVEASESYMYAANNRKTHTPYWYYRLGYVLDKAGYQQESCDAFLMMKKINRDGIFSKNTIEKIEKIGFNAYMQFEKAKVFKQKKQWWQAVESFDEAIKLSKEVSPVWYKEYALALMQMNRQEEASKAWEEALVSSKDANDWFMYSDALSLSKQKDKYEEAVAKTIALDNKFNAKKYGIGIFYEKKGKWQEASKAYANQVLKEPLDAELRYRYALSLDRCYEWAEAEKEYARAIAIKPENIDWYYRLGFVRERQEKYVEASESYMYAANNRKTHTPYWYYRLGYVLEKAGYQQESCDAFLMMKKIEREKEDEEILESKAIDLDFAYFILDENTTKKDIFKHLIEEDKIKNEEIDEVFRYILNPDVSKQDIWNNIISEKVEKNGR